MAIDRDELYRDSNKFAAEYAKNAIQFAFLLNGAAATALFSKADKAFICPATFLAFGALFAVLCMGLSYVVQMFLCETWRQEKEPYTFFLFGKFRKITLVEIEKLRFQAIVLWCVSMFLFMIGVGIAVIV